MMRLILVPKSIEGIKEKCSNHKVKNWAKMPSKITKIENIATQDMR
jgi:hypothetical protein